MDDPTFNLAREALRNVQDSAAIELEFDNVRAWRPVLSILKRLRDQAAGALIAMVTVSPEDAKEIRRLQNQVQLFSEFIQTTRAIYHAGIEAGDLLDAADREELRDLIDPPDDRVERDTARDQTYDN